MSEPNPVRILGENAIDAEKEIRELADNYRDNSVEVVSEKIRSIIRAHHCHPSEYVSEIARRIVDGHRGNEIFPV